MPDESTMENLKDIINSIDLIQERFSSVTKPDDFVLSPDGILLLDSISMRLQMVGELLKKTDKTNPTLFEQYPDIEWANIMKMRDLISHHYNQIDHEIIYDICKNSLFALKNVINAILANLDGNL
ncbi:MAG: DUF86 domain-containing protein [Proteobacteria bacterium]|nr:DUF86 domain-containing protein [Pseudomonadota bacterium]MBU4471235.1 DUF86 domain-containing protein [Pseudomonadota bacterium]MCG2753209.1 DUF86 domain-containing protein [Desulfobacteraceae bacterium]